MNIQHTLAEAIRLIQIRNKANDADLTEACQLLDSIEVPEGDLKMPFALTAEQNAPLTKAEEILNVWLVDNTDDVFEEEPEIDNARSLLNDILCPF